MAEQIAAVVLAAGMSRRMGRPKALLPLGGVPMIVRVVEPILSIDSIHPVVVVTGHQPELVMDALSGCRVEFVHNAEYAEGMLSSVKAGARAIAGRCDAFFLVLGDQPLVQRSTYQSLMNAAAITPSPGTPGEGGGEGSFVGREKTLTPTLSRGIAQGGNAGRENASSENARHRILQPRFGDARGHPILLFPDSVDQILALPADGTLKDYTRRAARVEIQVDDPGVLADIDTPSDYDLAVQQFLKDRSDLCQSQE